MINGSNIINCKAVLAQDCQDGPGQDRGASVAAHIVCKYPDRDTK